MVVAASARIRVAVLVITGLCGCSQGSGATFANPDASFGVAVCSSDAGTVPPGCPGDGGTCVIAAGQDTPWAIAVDSAHVYWTTLVKASTAGSANGGTVVVAPLAGGPSTTIASGLSLPMALATDGTNVYWADESGILKTDVDVGDAPAPVLSGLGPVARIVVNGDNVYADPGSSIVRVGIDGGTPQVVVADAGGALAADSQFVYWGSVEGDGGALFSVPVDGGATRRLAVLPYFPTGIVVDGDTLYCTVFNGFVMSMPRNGGMSTTIASGLNAAYGLAVDSNDIYWTTQDVVMKAPKGGGTPAIVGSNPSTVLVAVNAAGVYWTAAQIAPCATDLATAGAVMKAPLQP